MLPRLGLFLFAYSTLALAQAGKPPTCDAPEFHQFDFWLGDWDVTSAGKLEGHSRIEPLLAGCLILENWSGTDGDLGKSMNFYQPATKKWRQVYVGLNWSIDYAGSRSGDSMEFQSERPLKDGRIVKLRLTFTPLAGGDVRQHKEQSLNGEHWRDVYDYRYSRPKQAAGVELKNGAGCVSPEQQQFRFWVGDWDVFEKGVLAGTNRVDSIVNGCIVMENWKDTSGGEGKSFNFFDLQSNAWRQIWVAPGGSLDLKGAWQNGAMRFTGQTHRRVGGPAQERLTFTPNADGSVHQFWERSIDDGKTWTVAFDGKYVRKGTADRPNAGVNPATPGPSIVF